MEKGVIICGKVIYSNPDELYHIMIFLENSCNSIVESLCGIKCRIYNGNYIKIFIKSNVIYLTIPLILYLKSILLSKYKIDSKFAIGIGEMHLYNEDLNYAIGKASELAFIKDEDLVVRTPFSSNIIDINSTHLKEFIETNKIEI